MADPREGPGGRGSPLSFRPNRDPKGRKTFFGDWLPPTPSKGLEDLDPPYYLKVWIWHCYAPINVNPVGGGGGRGGEGGAGKGWGFDKFQNFFIKFPMMRNERSIKSVKKDHIPGEKI